MPATLKKAVKNSMGSLAAQPTTSPTHNPTQPMVSTTGIEPQPTHPVDVSHITRALAQPFELSEVKFKPQTVKNNRALALAYIDARVIQDRLDEVLGVENWQDDYQLLPDGSVLCRLRLKLGPRWITKMDVGSPSEQSDSGDRLKAAFSDALKRAAVKFGIGRYLYRLPALWCDYDPVKKTFTNLPKLPAFAMPTPMPQPVATNTFAAPAPAPTAAAVSVAPRSDSPTGSTPPRANPANRPTTGLELQRRLRERDEEYSRDGRCNVGALLAHVTQAGIRAGYSADLTTWNQEAIDLAIEETRKFRDSHPASKPGNPVSPKDPRSAA
ncbi:Rad52/Rad22 family DNA repair protein [Tuwongella immobilis]|uniref:Rad52/22 double-strand break repair protein n=1 Tax=Tuwongella immobilis TaxID=692036 RepID=A0A6C2YPW7_9BACT|nr:Rad52/Rad22 family DNA repair protein [Tuwongella immobilis]VIP03434.1 rad52 22 double-strand break repair protein : Uncharacterized protein OS=uncultured bacterium GN=ACD_20C00398G0011 PE=4 SV=1: Rad52_Rad22 [Tuwongella immobilis]VTS04240.1 rad52 22 double-strand break repair protein : Uncharacterized protein OS=uncultured bacterium GN=ACD_20C00398G0011 PE=4 SV=1: Rad52_Rad22 [Tuwongella immobilis]